MILAWPVGWQAPVAVGLDGTGNYINWGVIQLSVANLVVIGVIMALFVAAVLLPFPGGRDAVAPGPTDPTENSVDRT